MPRIPPKFLNCVTYFYEDEVAARFGYNPRGTGFFIASPTVIEGRSFPYLVTNQHIIKEGLHTLRLEKRDGDGFNTLTIEPSKWFSLDKYDIAVTPLSATLQREHQMSLAHTSVFLTQERKEKEKIGVGEDVFMVGLYVDLPALGKRPPSVRFGNISMDPYPIEQFDGSVADSYCIDMRSRGGYSGSPVFVYRTPGYDLEDQLAPNLSKASFLLSGANHLSLLGIHWGQFPEIWEVTSEGNLKDEAGASEVKEPLLTDGKYIKGLSGMTCVLPAWSILEVLDHPVLQAIRDHANSRLVKVPTTQPAPAVVQESVEAP